MSLFIQDAIAAVGIEGGQGGGGPLGSILILVVFILIFYFLLWRPQSKRAKEHRALVSDISIGDEIMTNGGLVGKINRVNDDYVLLNVAEGVDIKMQRNAITRVLPKGTIKSLV